MIRASLPLPRAPMPLAPHLVPALLLGLFACTGEGPGAPSGGDTGEAPFTFPSPEEARPALRGSAGPQVSFAEDELWENCAPLYGGEQDVEHHNLVGTYRGHLVMPWTPEFGTGGISFFDMEDPCEPEEVGQAYYSYLRESHALGFLHLPEGDPQAGDYLVTTGTLGVIVWDVSDEALPEPLAYLQLPGVLYPDAYARVVLSVFWQHPWLYVAGADNGLYIVDTSDLAEPELAGHYTFDTDLRAGGVFVVGTLMMVGGAEQAGAALLDVSDPVSPQLFPGGLFQATDDTGTGFEAYHANLAGDHALFARKEGAGGVMVADISDPTAPAYAGHLETTGNGGYVFYDEGFVFLGESDVATVIDARAGFDAMEILGQGHLPGDLDTITPYGNVAVLSVDEDAEDDIASVVMPWSTEPDLTGPEVMRTVPADGDVGVAPSARIGVNFTEFIDPASVQPGTVRLTAEDGRAVDGWGSGQEAVASYAPKEPLQPGTTYTFEVVAGGITDLNGNPVEETLSVRFTTAGSR